MVLDAVTKDRLRQQIEFYFSDSNLPRDKFLQEQVAADAEGYVDITLLSIFQRVRSLLKSTITDPANVSEQTVADVADALEGSSSLALSADRKRVRRAAALKDSGEVAREVDERSLYASPFPFDATLDALSEFFRQHGSVQCVRMRRHMLSKDFNGSVFVEFSSVEEADKVRGIDLVYDGAPLTMEPKLDYIKRKGEERAAREAAAPPAAASGPASRKRRAEGEPGEGAEAEGAAGEGEGGDGGDAQAPEEPELGDYEPGCILHFDFGDAEFAEAPTYGLVKDTFGGRREGGVQFVEYAQGAKSGNVRFDTAAQAQAALGRAEDGKLMVAGYSATLRILEGEDEETFLKAAAKQRAEADKRRKEEGGGRGGRGGRGGGRGGRGRGRGGRGRGRGRRN